jgi:hypothetical protein
LAKKMPPTKANPIALRCVRDRLGARLPRDVTDSEILGAVDVYRRPPKRGRGRPRKGEQVGTENMRAEALARLLRLERDPADIASDLRQRRAARLDRLRHLGVAPNSTRGRTPR